MKIVFNIKIFMPVIALGRSLEALTARRHRLLKADDWTASQVDPERQIDRMLQEVERLS